MAVVNRCECVKSENIPRFRKFTEKRDIIVQRERKRKRGRREERVRDEREREDLHEWRGHWDLDVGEVEF